MDNIVEFPKAIDTDGDILAQLAGTQWEAEAWQIFEEGRQARIKEIEEQDVKDARDRCIGIAKLYFGEKEGARLDAIVQSGMTVEQYRNLKPQLKAAGESQELKALRLVHSALTRPTDEPDFMAVVEETMARDGVTKSDAMAIVATQQPELHKRYLEARNPGRQLDL